jgi:hypothetical protein
MAGYAFDLPVSACQRKSSGGVVIEGGGFPLQGCVATRAIGFPERRGKLACMCVLVASGALAQT